MFVLRISVINLSFHVNFPLTKTLKAQELKPVLGLKKSLATRNLLAPAQSTAATSSSTTVTTTSTSTSQKNEVKQATKEETLTTAAVVTKPDAYSGKEALKCQAPDFDSSIINFFSRVHVTL